MDSFYLESELLYFKKLECSDITEEYVSWMNDSVINNFMETRFFPHSKKDVENFVESVSNDQNSILFGVFDKKNSKHIGNVKLGPINWIHRKAMISLFIGDKEYWGKGYASESIRLITDYGFFTLNMHKLDAGVYADNIASKKAFEKNGFHIEGLKKDDCFVNSKWTDVILMGRINENFL